MHFQIVDSRIVGENHLRLQLAGADGGRIGVGGAAGEAADASTSSGATSSCVLSSASDAPSSGAGTANCARGAAHAFGTSGCDMLRSMTRLSVVA
jgi:hypothetical protein